jgi:hypothetical protein
MFLPIGDEPNPHHLPVTTVALIAINVAVYLLITLPLGARPPDPADPALAEYLRAILPLLPPGTSPEQVLREISAYDLVVYKWGFRPDAASIVTLFTSTASARPGTSSGTCSLASQPRCSRWRSASDPRSRWSAPRAPFPGCSASTWSGSPGTS